MSFRETVRDSLIAPDGYDEAGMTDDSKYLHGGWLWLLVSVVLVLAAAAVAGLAVFG